MARQINDIAPDKIIPVKWGDVFTFDIEGFARRGNSVFLNNAIQSPNFKENSSGWMLDSNGNFKSKRVLIGNLKGSAGKTTNCYGIYLGDYTTGKYLIYDDVSGNLIVNGYQSLSTVAQFTASNNLKASADTEEYLDNVQVMTKAKEIQMGRVGTIRVKFDLKVNNGALVGTGRIYKNDVAVGTTRTTSSTDYTTYSEDITVDVNDKISIYMMENLVSNGYRVYLQNFRLYYDVSEVADYTILDN